MARDKFIEGRNEGMAFALKIAKEEGIEALEHEVKLRGLTYMPSHVPKSAIKQVVDNINMNVIDTFTILLVATLRDEFGFGEKRILRAVNRFNSKAADICDDLVTWQDYIEALKEELGISLSIRENNKDVEV